MIRRAILALLFLLGGALVSHAQGTRPLAPVASPLTGQFTSSSPLTLAGCPSAGQTWVWNGTAWACSVPSPTTAITGTLTSGRVPVANGAHALIDGSWTDTLSALSTASTVTIGNYLVASQIGIGTVPTKELDIVETTNSGVQLTRYGGTPGILCREALGTAGAPTQLTAGFLCQIRVAGYTSGGSFTGGASMFNIMSNGAWTPSDNGAYFRFDTIPAGATAAVDRVTIAANGFVGIGGSFGGVVPYRLTVAPAAASPVYHVDDSGNWVSSGTGSNGGALDMTTHQIHNVVDPTSAQDAATQAYVLAHAGSGTVTSITAGSGLTASPASPITTSGTLAVDTSVIQARVTGTCTSPNSIASIASGGTVTCTTGVLNTSNVAGTTNNIAKFTGPNTVGNGLAGDDGTAFTYNGATVFKVDTAGALTAAGVGTFGSDKLAVGGGVVDSFSAALSLQFNHPNNGVNIGNSGVGLATAPITMNGLVTHKYNGTGQTANKTAYNIDLSAATLNTTAAGLTATGINITAAATRSAGANNLTNTALSLAASGGQINNALTTTTGDVLLAQTSGVVRAGTGASTSTAGSAPLIVANAGATGFTVRDTTNSREFSVLTGAGGIKAGTFTGDGLVLVTNGTTAMLIASSNQDVAFSSNFSGNPSNAPTLSSCGTSPSVVGSNNGFVITVGTGATTCTATFSHAFVTGSVCTAMSNDSTAGELYLTAQSAAAITIGHTGTGFAGDKLNVTCIPY